MPRILAILFLAFSLAAGAAPAAHAQEPDVPPVMSAPTANTSTGNPDDANKPLSFPVSTDYDGALASIVQWIMLLFGWLVGVAAMTLDNAVYYTVVTMGSYVKDLAAVGIAWRILRDIGNIVLIFGFLAIGITTILNVDWYGGGKKMLPAMLAAAVFLNFSLFITEAVIDAGNLFATQFYTQINGGRPAGAKGFDTITSDGISNKIMGQLGLQTIYNGGRVNTQVFKNNNSIIIGFMGILLFIILAFVLFSLAFVLIARFVKLIFLIILSPIGFAGYAIPQLKSVSEKWFKDLIGQTITAPILLLLLYVALAVITDANFLKFSATGASSYTDWTGFVPNADGSFNYTGFAGMILSFLVAMGLLIFVVITSKNLSAFGAAGASKLAGKLTFGATAWAGRTSIGWGSQAASQAIRRSSWGATKRGRILANTFDWGAKASFDMRGVSAFGGLKEVGIDAGKAKEGGYRKTREETIKKHEEYVKSVTEAIEDRGETKGDLEAVAKSKKQAAEAHQAAQAEHNATAEEVARRKSRLEQLEEEKKKDRYFDNDPSNVQRLESAKKDLAASEGSLAKASVNLERATKQLETAEKQKVEDVTKARIEKEQKEAKEKYAKSIKNSLGGMILFGPGGDVAARKILKKKKNVVDIDELNKFIEGKDKPKDKKEEKSEEEEEKPKEGH